MTPEQDDLEYVEAYLESYIEDTPNTSIVGLLRDVRKFIKRQDDLQIIVNQLRPMSDAREEGFEYLVIRKDDEQSRFIAVEYIKLTDGSDCWYTEDAEKFLGSQLIGFIKMPIYQPKQEE